MSTVRGILELTVAREVALEACRAAFGEMGWRVTNGEPDGLAARQDPARLPCHYSPASAEIRISGSERASAVSIETKVPGFGPFSSSHAHNCQEALVRRLHKHATTQ